MKVAVLILAVAIVGAFAQDTTTKPGPPPFVCTSNAFVCKVSFIRVTYKYSNCNKKYNYNINIKKRPHTFLLSSKTTTILPAVAV